VVFKAELLNLHDTCGSVGAQGKANDPGNKVVEPSAVSRLVKFLAVGARTVAGFHTARPDPAPRRLCVLVTPQASVLQIGLARTAVEPTEGDQFGIGNNLFHKIFLLILTNNTGPTSEEILGCERW
jgi:hypothetical protein